MKKEKLLIYICVVIFIGLCLGHYFSARPMWLDEDFVYKNLISHDTLELFGPLDPVQSFPRVHLAIIKAISAPFDYHVYALRFLSLIFMISAFLLWVKMLRADCRDDLIAFLTLFAITASYKFSYYGAELKPYSMDVLVVAIYALYVHYQRIFEYAPPARRDYVIAALLPLLLFFSYAAIFVFWVVGFNFLLQLRKNRSVWKIFVLNALLSLACFGIYYLIDIRYSITVPGVNYWDGHFICYEDFGCFWDKFGDGIRRMVIYPFEGLKPQRYAASLFIPFTMFALFIYGVKRILKDRGNVYHLDSLSLFLFVELFVVSSFGYYPFTGERLTLFLSPFIIYMMTKGLFVLVKKKILVNMLMVFFLVFYVICLVRTTYSYVELYTG